MDPHGSCHFDNKGAASFSGVLGLRPWRRWLEIDIVGPQGFSEVVTVGWGVVRVQNKHLLAAQVRCSDDVLDELR